MVVVCILLRSYEMASKNGADFIVKTDDLVQSAIAAAMARAKQVPPSASLVETLVQDGWKDWDDSQSNIVVSDVHGWDIACCLDDDEITRPRA
jgi:hypothetical protein